MQSATKRVVCIGGGHCNCQVLKLLKSILPESVKLTLINESPKSFYSGMLPGTTSKLYKDEDLQIEMAPLAAWCRADYIEKRVSKVVGNDNQVHLDDGTVVDYDVLVLNVGSRTRGGDQVPGVWEHSLTTRPINDFLGKITKREEQLLAKFETPSVVVCGAGAAGTELAFAFKKRWSKLFGQEIKVTLASSSDTVLRGFHPSTIEQVNNKLAEHQIDIVYNAKIEKIEADGVSLKDGRKLLCNVPIWATGAEPQGVSAESDLDLLKGYFRVNNNLQSTSHSNIFAGGDCITMESYVDKPYPTKAGVYAVRAGPIIAQNVVHFLKDEKLVEYVPQPSFLALLMTGDGKALGSKFGITFSGRWVWEMKDYIDTGFMKLFDPKYLFNDYKNKGTAEPIENAFLFDDEKAEVEAEIGHLRPKVAAMSALEAAEILGCGEEETAFHERLMIFGRMANEDDFADEVVKNFKPPYYTK